MRDFSGCPLVKTASNAEGEGSALGRELKSHVLCDIPLLPAKTNKQTKNQNNQNQLFFRIKSLAVG